MTSRPPKVYPVIHVADIPDVVEDAELAVDRGADGVFLIDHDADDDRLVAAIRAVRAALPQLFLGANVIKRSPTASLEVLHERLPEGIALDALWTDNSGVTPAGVGDEVAGFAAARERLRWTGRHFGGVAFKYQQPVELEALPALGALARGNVDVATTSGPGTGQPIDHTRLLALREGLGEHPLALASGVTPDNVGEVADLVDHILVSTGIASPAGRLDPQRLQALLANVG
ncbi:MAG: hypothetical protein KG028_10680 [Actinobacteria bacterium]|nr:hypothetical protein [Actinomycetota bacterium]